MNYIEVIFEPESPKMNRLEPFVLDILQKLGIDEWSMGLLITNDKTIREHNKKWRNIDAPTDVLSFVLGEGEAVPILPGVPHEAGDVIISLETVARNAANLGIACDEEFRRVLIHGILHLSGMDHPGDDYDGEMLKRQEELLAGTECLLEGSE